MAPPIRRPPLAAAVAAPAPEPPLATSAPVPPPPRALFGLSGFAVAAGVDACDDAVDDFFTALVAGGVAGADAVALATVDR